MKKEPLVLQTAEPINDGGRRLNVIYFITSICTLIFFLMMGCNFFGVVFAIVLGLAIGWLIKNKIADIRLITTRNIRFRLNKPIPYPELIHQLIPLLTPLGAQIEKSSGGEPVITYDGSIYDVIYNDDNTFCIWWRKNLVKAFFMVDNISAYRKQAVAMGIIGYHVQQICNSDSSEGMGN